jgi:mono/diheme cytochrome c family protein
MKKIIAVVTVVFVTSGLYATVGAQAPKKSVKDGVYTEAQAKRGEALYKEQCAACHGDNLEGSGPMPPLAGADFVKNWKNVGDLFDKIHSSMPASAPGSLTEAQTADIIAYMFSVGKFPAGQSELEGKMDTLTAITIEPAGDAAAPAGAAPAGAAPTAPAPGTTPQN